MNVGYGNIGSCRDFAKPDVPLTKLHICRKSTFINFLIGRDVLPSGDLPTTALPTIIRHNPDAREPLLTLDPMPFNEALERLREIQIATRYGTAEHLNHDDDEAILRYLAFMALTSDS